MELNKDTLWDFFKAMVSKNQDTTEDNPKPTENPVVKTKDSIPIIKQFEEEKMEVIEVLYCPPEEDDLHGERISELELRKMVDNFNENISTIKGNLGHVKNTEKFKPIKAWINECDCYIGETLVKEGMPLVKNKFYDKELYELRKSGVLRGVSIGAMARSVEK